jgi:CheY-like chemotaxis protein
MQIEQILMNLAANARDAMPQGGRCNIETGNIMLDEDYVAEKNALIPMGRYAVLTVSDTGCGISPEHIPHIFEPFYTTKSYGKGTGLGLATVYGIVKQNHGFVWAYSELGIGTVFKIYFPCVLDRMTLTEVAEPANHKISRGNETVLLVEDEDALRRATSEFLSMHGYTVLEAKDGQDALSVAKQHNKPIDLAVTDVVMPKLSGGQLAKELAIMYPDTRVLFVSGYAGQTILDHKVVDVENNFLQKPFTLAQLANKVRLVLERGSIATQLPADTEESALQVIVPGD